VLDNTKFIVIDGIDGCGKTTQLNKIKKYYNKQGADVLCTKEPGGTDVGIELRKMLISTTYNLESESEMMLYNVDRLEHQKKIIEPALKSGKTIICDRFASSTYAYQVYGRKLDITLFNSLNNIAVSTFPDKLFILDIKPETALNRAMTRLTREGKVDSEGKFEQLGLQFFRDVRNGFLDYAEKHDFCTIIDAENTITSVTNKILEHL
jgi:dTMP kinase